MDKRPICILVVPAGEKTHVPFMDEGGVVIKNYTQKPLKFTVEKLFKDKEKKKCKTTKNN